MKHHRSKRLLSLLLTIACIGDNRFAPDGICTRGQIVTFLYRAMK